MLSNVSTLTVNARMNVTRRGLLLHITALHAPTLFSVMQQRAVLSAARLLVFLVIK